MFLPFHDKNNLEGIRFQYVTITLIAMNVAIFLIYPVNSQAILGFALVPADFFSLFQGTEGVQQTAQVIPNGIGVPKYLTPITYMFFHGGWMHLIGNMMFLWVFGDNVEDAMGHIRYLLFYLLCGIGGGLFHSAFAPESNIALIGASGAISGIIAAYLMLHPNIRVWVLVLFRIPIPISAAIALGAWIGFQFLNAFYLQPEGNTAWLAHVGGILTGAILVLFMRRPGVKLFDMHQT